MITRVIPWTIEIAALNTRLRVGIWDHEREPQAIQIHLSIRAIAPVLPQAIDDCLNYQPICHWIVNVWPEQAHTMLLETKMSELLAFIFNFDARIEWVDAVICKPTAIAEARAVGVRMALSRDEYEAAFEPARWRERQRAPGAAPLDRTIVAN